MADSFSTCLTIWVKLDLQNKNKNLFILVILSQKMPVYFCQCMFFVVDDTQIIMGNFETNIACP